MTRIARYDDLWVEPTSSGGGGDDVEPSMCCNSADSDATKFVCEVADTPGSSRDDEGSCDSEGLSLGACSRGVLDCVKDRADSSRFGPSELEVRLFGARTLSSKDVSVFDERRRLSVRLLSALFRPRLKRFFLARLGGIGGSRVCAWSFG